jgi:hypothetical protein
MGRLVVRLFGAGQVPHEHRWLPTIDGTGYVDDREIHCAGCNRFMHRRAGKYVEGRNPHRERCVRPQCEIIPHNESSAGTDASEKTL